MKRKERIILVPMGAKKMLMKKFGVSSPTVHRALNFGNKIPNDHDIPEQIRKAALDEFKGQLMIDANLLQQNNNNQ